MSRYSGLTHIEDVWKYYHDRNVCSHKEYNQREAIRWAQRKINTLLSDRELITKENSILREALKKIIVLKDNQSISYEKWELMVDVAVDALNGAGGGE